MGRRSHCLDCAWCAEGPGADGEPCFQCEYSDRLLPVGSVWRKACRDFRPFQDEAFSPPRPPRSER